MEMVRWIKEKGKPIEYQDYNGNMVEHHGEPRKRIVVLYPLFLNKEIMKLNPDIKFGDKVLVVFDHKASRVLTVLPYRKIGNTVVKSTYKTE
ncbi:MAG: hypothetical protein WC389_18550 [Lutibacter sp.]|jgi:hypothetical protein